MTERRPGNSRLVYDKATRSIKAEATMSTPLEVTLYDALRTIAKEYQTPGQIRREARREQHGPEYTEMLEMAYENIQDVASIAIKGVRIKRATPSPPEAQRNSEETDNG